jgi:carbonic anhydrase
MTVLEDLATRNADFAAYRFPPDLRLNPSCKTMLIGCVDPRVDPALVLGVELGEAAVIRNVGGRVTPATLKTLTMLGAVGRANGGGPGQGWNLIVLHHTDCGMTDLAAFPTCSPNTSRSHPTSSTAKPSRADGYRAHSRLASEGPHRCVVVRAGAAARPTEPL